MKKLFLSIIFLIIFITVNCSSLPPRTNKESSIIAINIALDVHSGLLRWEPFQPEKIYFIKIEDENSLKVEKLISSNYTTESWVPKADRYTTYLMNIKSGKYAAVVASGLGLTSKRKFIVLFPKKVINSSIITVQPNSMAYMGTFYLTTGNLTKGMEGADELQEYYYKLFTSASTDPDVRKEVTFLTQLQAPQEKETYNSEEFKKEFIKKQVSEFKDTEWKDAVK